MAKKNKQEEYDLNASLWVYPGESAKWHFLTLPKAVGVEIKENFGKHKKQRGFGSIRVSVTIGDTTFDTSIFPDKSSGSYLLPIKASVRKAEDIEEKDKVKFRLKLK